MPTDLKMVSPPGGLNWPPSSSEPISTSSSRLTWPASMACSTSPASASTAASSSMTTRLARAKASEGISHICGVYAPTALMCTCGPRSAASNSGRCDRVAAQITSAPRTASAGLATGRKATPGWLAASSAHSSSRRPPSRPQTRTSRTGRTAHTAAT